MGFTVTVTIISLFLLEIDDHVLSNASNEFSDEKFDESFDLALEFYFVCLILILFLFICLYG